MRRWEGGLGGGRVGGVPNVALTYRFKFRCFGDGHPSEGLSVRPAGAPVSFFGRPPEGQDGRGPTEGRERRRSEGTGGRFTRGRCGWTRRCLTGRAGGLTSRSSVQGRGKGHHRGEGFKKFFCFCFVVVVVCLDCSLFVWTSTARPHLRRTSPRPRSSARKDSTPGRPF